jgi:hypothetical protein
VKKKRTAAKMQPPNQHVACNFGGQDLAEPGCLMTNEYVERGWWAHDTANQLRLAMRSYKRAIEPTTDSNGRRRALEDAKDYFLEFGLLINESDLADSLRLVADALQGKLRGAKDDERILEAYFKAVQTGKRHAERRKNSPPLFSEVYDAYIDIAKSKWVDTRVGWKSLNKDALRRRLKILGCPLSVKPGQHRKSERP